MKALVAVWDRAWCRVGIAKPRLTTSACEFKSERKGQGLC